MAWTKQKIRRTPAADTEIIPVVRQRIVIPQPAERPLDIHSKDLVKKEYVHDKPWWMTIHRKGVKRPELGESPLELRAVPRSMVRGTLPERIVYNALVNLLHMTPDVDFDFQSSQSGGRIELGGIVADFLFPYLRMIIQVQGPTHSGFLRSKKDQEQIDILADMGYTTFEIDDDVIYNEYRFENRLREIFNLGGVGVGSGGNYNATMATGIPVHPGITYATYSSMSEDEYEAYMLNLIHDLLQQCTIMLRSF